MKICPTVWGHVERKGVWSTGAKGKQMVIEDHKPWAKELGFRFGSASHPRLGFEWGQIRGQKEGLLGQVMIA